MAILSDDGATIFALSTAGLPSAIAIVRTSGPASRSALEALAGRVPEPRYAALMSLRDPADGTPIDRALILWLPGPASETGEDMVEYHLHGSRAVASKLLETLGKYDEMRPAEAGEFLRRAFLNGKMDLTAAEGLGDLLDAETESQRRHALAIAEGGLAARIAGWRERLLGAEARLEAVLNFSDEGDVGEGDESFALDAADDVHGEIMETLAAPPAERLRDGIRVALAGPPNAGKSTLFNALVAREAAIVSPVAGTTRDVIEAPVDIDGIAFVFSDTAGLRDSGEAIEEEGVRRARSVSERSDILFWMGETADAPKGDHIIILHPRADEPRRAAKPAEAALSVSATTGEGMAALRALLLERARSLLPREDQLALNQRQRLALREAADALAEARAGDWILLVEALRGARMALERLGGGGGVETMLDALFGRFCIGK
ncbi:tRNA uridine-5-carboxymethylaminomethyl(34) synthesis GTPase MnmE [Parasphingopyxis marina]|uniref:tRNA uridine-5-carboxymethylaminomethyl(34) synthesis GTPase MnmE n=1 Tax=Parasphingopyxis marina TaxID=2761622 RepID=UPI002E283F9F|nr:tRNA uridine-5-carboxymethylaminomethyl(34) synthesis GTPase MnmE [Parasphingopyxis marina]